MKRLLAILALVCTLLVPVATPALSIPTDTASLTAIAEWAGCKNAQVIDTDGFGFNAYFGVDWNGRPSIVFINGTAIPEQHRFTIFLHELGHCLQYMEGTIRQMDSVTRELDADGRAAQLACALHMDGPRMVREVFEWMRQEFGYNGDSDHGTLEQRIEQVNRAKSHCPAYQAPLQS